MALVFFGFSVFFGIGFGQNSKLETGFFFVFLCLIYFLILFFLVFWLKIWPTFEIGNWGGGGGLGGCNPKKPNATANFKFGTGFFRFSFRFFVFFSVFFGFSILANFDLYNGFLLSGSFC